MVLKTKCVLEKPSKEDGLRICVMRFIRKSYEFDLWWKELAPSSKLLNDYKRKRINWEEYIPRYNQEVLESHKESVKLLAEMAMKKDITLLCYERTPEKCHRRLLAEECEKYQQNLELIVK